MRKPFYEKQWVVIDIGGDRYTPLSDTRKGAIAHHVSSWYPQVAWKDAYRRGFRCIQVEIKEIQKVKK